MYEFHLKLNFSIRIIISVLIHILGIVFITLFGFSIYLVYLVLKNNLIILGLNINSEKRENKIKYSQSCR